MGVLALQVQSAGIVASHQALLHLPGEDLSNMVLIGHKLVRQHAMTAHRPWPVPLPQKQTHSRLVCIQCLRISARRGLSLGLRFWRGTARLSSTRRGLCFGLCLRLRVPRVVFVMGIIIIIIKATAFPSLCSSFGLGFRLGLCFRLRRCSLSFRRGLPCFLPWLSPLAWPSPLVCVPCLLSGSSL